MITSKKMIRIKNNILDFPIDQNDFDKKLLSPILNSKGKLLAPIKINTYIFNEIYDIAYILSRFPNNNFVKKWIFSILDEEKIIVNAKINNNISYMLDIICEIKKERVLRECKRKSGLTLLSYHYLNQIFEDKFPDLPIFKFNTNEKSLDTKILKDDEINKLYTGCYIITFNNKLYYYIGSTCDLKERLKDHTFNIETYCKAIREANMEEIINNRLNETFKYFLESSPRKDFNFNILYISTNYLNKFKSIYQDYELNKAE